MSARLPVQSTAPATVGPASPHLPVGTWGRSHPRDVAGWCESLAHGRRDVSEIVTLHGVIHYPGDHFGLGVALHAANIEMRISNSSDPFHA